VFKLQTEFSKVAFLVNHYHYSIKYLIFRKLLQHFDQWIIYFISYFLKLLVIYHFKFKV